ncbi:MAG: ATP-binding cassette domain-containing protein [Propionibacteriaceae bacterium]|jgi:peptide/nickel transport system ATP-binding protein|nr:ATP-binding cassette domain-containing protein [Propionibacteriaceae bacterium]
MSEPLVQIRNLVVEYRNGRRAAVRASDDVSLDIREGETLGLVGESGSGKSTLGDAILGFAPAVSGSIRFRGEEILHATPARRRQLTRSIQVVFQNPYGSLNPMKSIGDTLTEPLLCHRLASRAEALEKAGNWLDLVGLDISALTRYPGDFSGGQRQRVAIARALIMEPDLVICDEAVSALDLSIQAQILGLLTDLKQRLGVTYLFITHDMAVVAYLADRIAVLHRGRIVEEGPAEVVSTRPSVAYTQALVAAAPLPDPVLQRERRGRRQAASAESEPAWREYGGDGASGDGAERRGGLARATGRERAGGAASGVVGEQERE